MFGNNVENKTDAGHTCHLGESINMIVMLQGNLKTVDKFYKIHEDKDWNVMFLE